MKKSVISGLMCGVFSLLIAENNVSVEYPNGYKEWKHVKTMIVKKNHVLGNIFHGIHHIYANDKAFEGYKNGKFEDGSVIALDFLNYEDVNETISETSRIYVAVMRKDEKKYAKTKGWGYEAYKEHSQDETITGDDVQKSCFNCHLTQEKNSYIFSKLRD